MKQQTLNFTPTTTLIDFIELTLSEDLSGPIDYGNPEHIKKFTEKLFTLSMPKNYTSDTALLLQLIEQFYDKIPESHWASFHFDTFIKNKDVMADFEQSLYEKYKDYISDDEWTTKILSSHRILPSKNITSHTAKAFDTYTYNVLPEEEKLRTKDFYKKHMTSVIEQKFLQQSFEIQAQIIKFLVEEHAKNGEYEYISSTELKELIKQMDEDLTFETLQKGELSGYGYNSHYTKASGTKEIYMLIMQNKFFTLSEKKELLYEHMKIDSNYMYQPAYNVRAIIENGVLEDVVEMFAQLKYPYNGGQKDTLISTILGINHIKVGRGIRLAAYLLDLCEKNFAVGKATVEYFLPSIKDEMLIDKKTNELNGIDFLMEYALKKSKNSTTIAASVAKVKTAYSFYEKDKLTMNLLQLELPFVDTRKFKL